METAFLVRPDDVHWKLQFGPCMAVGAWLSDVIKTHLVNLHVIHSRGGHIRSSWVAHLREDLQICTALHVQSLLALPCMLRQSVFSPLSLWVNVNIGTHCLNEHWQQTWAHLTASALARTCARENGLSLSQQRLNVWKTCTDSLMCVDLGLGTTCYTHCCVSVKVPDLTDGFLAWNSKPPECNMAAFGAAGVPKLARRNLFRVEHAGRGWVGGGCY